MQLPGDPEPVWHALNPSDLTSFPWADFTAMPVNAEGIFTDEPIGWPVATITNAIAFCKARYPNAPARLRRTHTQQYRIQWQGKTSPADGSALLGKWFRELIGTLDNNGNETITSFTSTSIP